MDAVPNPETTRYPRSPLVLGRAFFLGVILLLFVGYLTYCVFSYGLNRFENADVKRIKEREKILADRLTEDAKWLHDSPSWFNKEKGLVRVPIEEAMQMTVADLGSIAPHPAELIAVNPPQPSAAPASPVAPASGVPAPSPSPAAPVAAPTPAAGATAPLPGAVPAPAASPAAAPAPMSTPAPAPAPAPAGATPSPAPAEPGVTPSGK